MSAANPNSEPSLCITSSNLSAASCVCVLLLLFGDASIRLCIRHVKSKRDMAMFTDSPCLLCACECRREAVCRCMYHDAAIACSSCRSRRWRAARDGDSLGQSASNLVHASASECCEYMMVSHMQAIHQKAGLAIVQRERERESECARGNSRSVCDSCTDASTLVWVGRRWQHGTE